MLDSPSRDRRSERREATQAEILDTAWDIAREKGLANLTLRDVAARIGMRAPSLYSYFESKNAIYDAMFAQAWTGWLAVMNATEATLPREPRAVMKAIAHTFFDYAVADLARHQLMNQRTIPGFVPSPEAYAPAVDALALTVRHLGEVGVDRSEDVDLYTAMIGGLIDSQQANDPGGDRWARLLDRAVEMLADNVGIPPRTPT